MKPGIEMKAFFENYVGQNTICLLFCIPEKVFQIGHSIDTSAIFAPKLSSRCGSVQTAIAGR